MISVKEAKKKIESRVTVLDSIEIETSKALNFVLSEDAISPIDMPPFDQSAMDGYALGSLKPNSEVRYEVKAGDDSSHIHLGRNDSARIFTGAMVPKGTVAIAKQEIVERQGERISLIEDVSNDMNIRPQGEQIKLGDIAMSAENPINPGGIGFLLGLGINKVKVHRKPKIALLVTGDELVKPGDPLTPGKIYESNSDTIKSALLNAGIECSVHYVKDNYKSTKTLISSAILENDLIISTGGISVGDHDYVGKSFEAINVEEVFYKVKQKPGKPLFFGLKGNSVIFGLPGNPAAALTCFYIYVLPAIHRLMGRSHTGLETRTFTLKSDFRKSANLSAFLKGHFSNNSVEILSAQSSAMLSSFASANCLVHLEEGRDNWSENDKVTAYILP